MASDAEMPHPTEADHRNQHQAQNHPTGADRQNQPQTETQPQTQNNSQANLAFILPFLLGFSARAATRTATQEENQESAATQSQIHFFFNPASGSVVIVDGFGNFPSEKPGPLPASKAAIEAMPRLVVTEESIADGECVICMEEWEVGAEAREMPCKHRFHSGCIEKWLGMHGTCPVCRYVMPAAEEQEKSGGEESQGNGGEREGGRRRAWVTVQAILVDGNGRERVSDSGSGSEGGGACDGLSG